jgi:hypothetical protein
MKKIILTGIILTFSISLFSQDYSKLAKPLHNVFLEFGGNSILYGINYELIFSQKENSFNAVRAGIHFSQNTINKTFFTFPVEYNKNIRIKKNHFFETGLGLTFWNTATNNQTGNGLLTVARLGYRYQTQIEGLMLRVGINPMHQTLIFNEPTFFKSKLILWAGVSIGYTIFDCDCR